MSRYRLGLLLCDHTAEPIAARFGDYPEMFANAFAAVAGPLTWNVFDVTRGELPAGAQACDGYLISGSRHGATDPLPWLEPLAQTIRAIASARRPLVGICFGHQVIGQALGGAVERAASGWGIGIHDYRVADRAPWMDPPCDAFAIPVCHRDQLSVLPAGAVRLAGSGHCENFVVQFGPQVLGFQGHPEFDADFLGAILESRRDTLPPPIYARARASLTQSADCVTINTWIARFLRLPPA